jgi:hypothetical protein
MAEATAFLKAIVSFLDFAGLMCVSSVSLVFPDANRIETNTRLSPGIGGETAMICGLRGVLEARQITPPNIHVIRLTHWSKAIVGQ